MPASPDGGLDVVKCSLWVAPKVAFLGGQIGSFQKNISGNLAVKTESQIEKVSDKPKTDETDEAFETDKTDETDITDMNDITDIT